jgi:hypothetical protein
MSANLASHYVQQYANTVQLLSQQTVSKLEATCLSGSHVGEQASPVDQYGKVEAVDATALARFADITRIDAPVDRRWVLPSDFHIPQLIDKRDILRVLTDPKSSEARIAIAGMNRQKDATLLAALGGTSKTGKIGATNTTLPAGQTVGVSFGTALSKMTVAKMREAKRILMANDVDTDMEDVYIVMSPTDHDNLLGEVTVTSRDYNDGQPVLKEGKVTRFLGMNIITSNLLGTGTDDLAGTSRPAYVYAKSGLYLGNWNNISVDISERKDLISLPWQIYTSMTIGATRLEEAKVVRIWCR